MKVYTVVLVCFFMVLPVVSFADVTTESSIDFDWTVSDGMNYIPALNNYQISHSYSYTGDWSDQQYLDTAGAGNPIDGDGFDYYNVPVDVDVNTNSSDWNNYINSNLTVSTTAAAAGIQGTLSSDAYAFFRPGYEYSRAQSGAGTTMGTYYNVVGSLEDMPNWVMSLNIDPNFVSTINGAYTDQQSISQFVISTGYRFGGLNNAYKFLSGPNLIGYVQSSEDGPVPDSYSFDLHLNPYDEDFLFDFDISTLGFDPTSVRFDLSFGISSNSIINEENPGDVPGTGDDPVVPEPATMFLLGSGLLGLLGFKKRK